MTVNVSKAGKWTIYIALGVCVGALISGRPWKASAQAIDNLTPGMIFGPLYVSDGQHIELCATFLSPGTISATVHFRNLTTSEVTKGQDVTLPSGGGACVTYRGAGQVIGMARGDGAASDWVSPSNALISSMSVIDDFKPGPGNRTSVVATVLGVPKIWVKGL